MYAIRSYYDPVGVPDDHYLDGRALGDFPLHSNKGLRRFGGHLVAAGFKIDRVADRARRHRLQGSTVARVNLGRRRFVTSIDAQPAGSTGIGMVQSYNFV